MSLVSSVHHVNYLVRDLEKSAERFAAQLGVVFGATEALPARGVLTRRVRLANCWFVLVQPTDSASAIGQRLANQGEGVFLVSFTTSSLDQARAQGAELGAERVGLDGWRVADLTALSEGSTVLQLFEGRDDDR